MGRPPTLAEHDGLAHSVGCAPISLVDQLGSDGSEAVLESCDSVRKVAKAAARDTWYSAITRPTAAPMRQLDSSATSSDSILRRSVLTSSASVAGGLAAEGLVRPYVNTAGP